MYLKQDVKHTDSLSYVEQVSHSHSGLSAQVQYVNPGLWLFVPMGASNTNSCWPNIGNPERIVKMLQV